MLCIYITCVPYVNVLAADHDVPLLLFDTVRSRRKQYGYLHFYKPTVNYKTIFHAQSNRAHSTVAIVKLKSAEYSVAVFVEVEHVCLSVKRRAAALAKTQTN
jgi:hypothetical protein